MSHYTHLTIEERESILRMRAEKKGIREIARELQRSASTISREICRNQERSGEYSPSKAEAAYHKRRQRCGRQRIFKVNPEAKRKVRHLFLDLHWSPEQISCRLRMEGSEVQVSYTTIYRGIYSHDLEEAKLSHGCRGMVRLLRHHGKTRHKKGTEERRGKIAISHPIEDRPDEANTRKEIGHWEADTVAGKTGKSCMITLADRKSRFLIGKRFPGRRPARLKMAWLLFSSPCRPTAAEVLLLIAERNLLIMLPSRRQPAHRSIFPSPMRRGREARTKTQMVCYVNSSLRAPTWIQSLIPCLIHRSICSIIVLVNVSAGSPPSKFSLVLRCT